MNTTQRLAVLHPDTPVYDGLMETLSPLPTFEPVDSHEQFLLRHDFSAWLYETTLRVERTTWVQPTDDEVDLFTTDPSSSRPLAPVPVKGRKPSKS